MTQMLAAQLVDKVPPLSSVKVRDGRWTGMVESQLSVDASLHRLEKMMPPEWYLHSVVWDAGVGYAVLLKRRGRRPDEQMKLEARGDTIAAAIYEAGLVLSTHLAKVPAQTAL